MPTVKPSETPHRTNQIEPITMRIPQACRYLGIGRSTLYVLIAKGAVESVKLGCSTLVVTESLKRLIEERRQPAAERAASLSA